MSSLSVLQNIFLYYHFGTEAKYKNVQKITTFDVRIYCVVLLQLCSHKAQIKAKDMCYPNNTTCAGVASRIPAVASNRRRRYNGVPPYGPAPAAVSFTHRNTDGICLKVS